MGCLCQWHLDMVCGILDGKFSIALDHIAPIQHLLQHLNLLPLLKLEALEDKCKVLDSAPGEIKNWPGKMLSDLNEIVSALTEHCIPSFFSDE